MDVEQAVRRRISVRSFLPDPVPAADVRALLEAAKHAPSGCNLQPWRVYALSGEPMRQLSAEVRTKLLARDFEEAEYPIIPAPLWDPFRTRQFECGSDLYSSVGVERHDRPARAELMARNADLFGAPVGLFFCIDRKLGAAQWADLGMMMQTVMLLAVERGLDTCAQEFWAQFPETVGEALGLPPELMLFSGMCLGRRDESHPINGWRTRRARLDEWVALRGFEKETEGSISPEPWSDSERRQA